MSKNANSYQNIEAIAYSDVAKITNRTVFPQSDMNNNLCTSKARRRTHKKAKTQLRTEINKAPPMRLFNINKVLLRLETQPVCVQ
jgi:hypothetical protein